MKWLALTLCFALLSAPAGHFPAEHERGPTAAIRPTKPQNKPQDDGPQNQISQEGPQNSEPPDQGSSDQPSASPSNGSQTKNSDAPKNAATGDQKSQPAQPAAKDASGAKPPRNQMYGLTENYSVELSPEWRTGGSGEIPPPAILSPYAPPFHLSGNLAFSDGNAWRDPAIRDLGQSVYWPRCILARHADPFAQRLGDELARFLLLLFFPAIRCLHPRSADNLRERRSRAINGRHSPLHAGLLHMPYFRHAFRLLCGAGELGNYVPINKRWNASACAGWQFLCGANGTDRLWNDDFLHIRSPERRCRKQ